MSCLPRSPSRGATGPPRSGARLHRPGSRRVTMAVAPLVAALSLSACAGGAIAANTPASNGKSFVSGSAGTTEFGAAGPAVPAVTGTTLSGASISMSGFRGHVVVVNFWGSWCAPCRAEARVLAALATRFRPDGVRFLGVDIRDSVASAQAFQRDFGITYPSLNDPGDQVALDFRATVPPAGIPTTLVVSATGRITARVIGPVTYQGLRRLITAAMAHQS